MTLDLESGLDPLVAAGVLARRRGAVSFASTQGQQQLARPRLEVRLHASCLLSSVVFYTALFACQLIQRVSFGLVIINLRL